MDDARSVLLPSAAVALLPVALCYALRWRLARGPVVPSWMFPTLVVLGAIGGVAMPLTAIGQIEWLFAPVADSPLRPAFFGSIVGASAEELGKSLILLAFVPTRWFRSTLDGLLYGFAAGIGFAAAENFLFFLDAYANGGSEAWTTTVIVRLVPSLVVHGGATAAVGAFLGAVRWERRLLVVFTAPVFGLALASLLHGAWNGLVTAAVATGDPFYDTLALSLLPATVVLLIALLAAALRLEAEVLRDELALEVRSGRLTTAELDAATKPTRRTLRFTAVATALAYAHRRARLEGRDVGDVDVWREKLARMRAERY
jgi:RsiW-degrading membrane proteinase PrsW (M82 family)